MRWEIERAEEGTRAGVNDERKEWKFRTKELNVPMFA
jgi:hypothetical protein